MKAYTAERWAGREIPLWNPLSGGGEPWLAQLQSGALYPGDLPFLLGWREGALLGIALHLALAAAGMAFWLWELGGSRSAALLAGGLYAGGGAFLSLVPVYNNACTAAWLPWLFAGARRVGRRPIPGSGLRDRRRRARSSRASRRSPRSGSAAAIVARALRRRRGRGAGSRRPARGAGRGARPAAAPGRPRLAGAALLPFAALLQSSERRARTTREEALASPVGRRTSPTSSRRRGRRRRERCRRAGAGTSSRSRSARSRSSSPRVSGAGLPGRRRLLAGLALLAGRGNAARARSLRAPRRRCSSNRGSSAASVSRRAGSSSPTSRWPSRRGRVSTAGSGAVSARPPLRGGRLPTAPRPAKRPARRRSPSRRSPSASLFVLLLVALAWFLPEARVVAGPEPDGGRRRGAAPRRRRDRPRGDARSLAPATPAPRSSSPSSRSLPLPYFAGEALASVPARGGLSPRPGSLAGLARGPEAGRVFAPAGQDRTLALRWKYAESAAWGREPSGARAAGARRLHEPLPRYRERRARPRRSVIPARSASSARPSPGAIAARILALLNVRHVLSPFPRERPGPPSGRRGRGAPPIRRAGRLRPRRSSLSRPASRPTTRRSRPCRRRVSTPGEPPSSRPVREGRRLPPPRPSGELGRRPLPLRRARARRAVDDGLRRLPPRPHPDLGPGLEREDRRRARCRSSGRTSRSSRWSCRPASTASSSPTGPPPSASVSASRPRVSSASSRSRWRVLPEGAGGEAGRRPRPSVRLRARGDPRLLRERLHPPPAEGRVRRLPALPLPGLPDADRRPGQRPRPLVAPPARPLPRLPGSDLAPLPARRSARRGHLPRGRLPPRPRA